MLITTDLRVRVDLHHSFVWLHVDCDDRSRGHDGVDREMDYKTQCSRYHLSLHS